MPDPALLCPIEGGPRQDDEDPRPPRGKLARLLAQAPIREAIRSAGAVVGFDIYEPDKTYVFYGEASGGRPWDGVARGRGNAVRVAVDFFTDDPQVLWAACVALKGSCCYGWPISAGATDGVAQYVAG